MLPRPLPKPGEPCPPPIPPPPPRPNSDAQAALEIAQHIVQIVLRLLRAVPGIAFFPARFVPSHELCLVISCGVLGSWMPSRAF